MTPTPATSPRPPSGSPGPPRRLVITICPREQGTVALAIARGGRKRRLDATGAADSLRDLIARRQLGGLVSVRDGCAGGCSRSGPNISVTIHAVRPPDMKVDHLAIGWKTYVYSLASLPCVATIIDENLYATE